MKTVGILGTSGMAREAGDVAWSLGMEPIYVARDSGELASWPYPDEVIVESQITRYADMRFVIGIGDGLVRRSVAFRLKDTVRFTNLIHDTATFGRRQRESMEDGVGIVVCAGARLTSGIEVGDFVIVNQNACVAHDVTIGHFVHLAPGACVSGNVDIGECCWIGAGSIINQGTPLARLAIAPGTIIGSGAVVTKSCIDAGTYTGVPARRIK